MYIGASIDVDRRRIEHFKPFRVNSLKDRLPLYDAIAEYGRENFSFEVIEETTLDELEEREEYYINKYNTVEQGYNVVKTSHNMHDEEYVQEVHGSFFSEWNKKQWQDEEYRRKMSKQSSLVQKERLKDPKYRAEKAKQLKKYTDTLKKTVEQYDKEGNLIAVYNGTREAERVTGISSQSISKVALGQRKTAGGYIWRYPQEKSVETIENK